MAFEMSDELLSTFVPIAVYWAYAGIYLLFANFDDYRLHPKGDEDKKNIVSKSTVIQGVLVQQAIQVAVSLILLNVKMFSLSCLKSQFTLFQRTFLLNKKIYFLYRCSMTEAPDRRHNRHFL